MGMFVAGVFAGTVVSCAAELVACKIEGFENMDEVPNGYRVVAANAFRAAGVTGAVIGINAACTALAAGAITDLTATFLVTGGVVVVVYMVGGIIYSVYRWFTWKNEKEMLTQMVDKVFEDAIGPDNMTAQGDSAFDGMQMFVPVQDAIKEVLSKVNTITKLRAMEVMRAHAHKLSDGSLKLFQSKFAPFDDVWYALQSEAGEGGCCGGK